MPDVTRYTPSQMGPAVAQLAENYNDALNVFDRIEDSIDYSKEGTQYESDLVAARAEIAEDDGYFSDISTALQGKTGQAEPYAKDELAQAVSALPTDLISKTITENGVYNASSDNADGYDVVTVEVNELNAFLTKTIKRFNLPDVTSINNYQFANQQNLEYVSMPNVITIGRQGFRECTKLSLDELPIGLTTIGSNAFERCPLTITELPPNISNIDDYAFSICTTIPFLDLSNLVSIPTLGGIHVFNLTTFPFYFRDQQQLDEWAAATNWSTYANRFQIKPSEVI